MDEILEHSETLECFDSPTEVPTNVMVPRVSFRGAKWISQPSTVSKVTKEYPLSLHYIYIYYIEREIHTCNINTSLRGKGGAGVSIYTYVYI